MHLIPLIINIDDKSIPHKYPQNKSVPRILLVCHNRAAIQYSHKESVIHTCGCSNAHQRRSGIGHNCPHISKIYIHQTWYLYPGDLRCETLPAVLDNSNHHNIAEIALYTLRTKSGVQMNQLQNFLSTKFLSNFNTAQYSRILHDETDNHQIKIEVCCIATTANLSKFHHHSQ